VSFTLGLATPKASEAVSQPAPCSNGVSASCGRFSGDHRAAELGVVPDSLASSLSIGSVFRLLSLHGEQRIRGWRVRGFLPCVRVA
jgi:hypothetical protein